MREESRKKNMTRRGRGTNGHRKDIQGKSLESNMIQGLTTCLTREA